MATHERRVVFFDLDGTLHQQDMFGSFMRYLLRRQPLNALLVLPLLSVIAIALLIKGRAARWPMSLLLWGCTFGHSEARLQALQADFVPLVSRQCYRFSAGSGAFDYLPVKFRCGYLVDHRISAAAG